MKSILHSGWGWKSMQGKARRAWFKWMGTVAVAIYLGVMALIVAISLAKLVR